MDSVVFFAGSTSVVLSTAPPASQNGAMKTLPSTAPVATMPAVAGTMAENHAALKAAPMSVEPPRPAGGTVRSSVPASLLSIRVRAFAGRGRGADPSSASRRSASRNRAAAASTSSRAAATSSLSKTCLAIRRVRGRGAGTSPRTPATAPSSSSFRRIPPSSD